MGTPIRSIIKFKGKKDYASIFELNIIIIKNVGGRGDDDPNNFNNNKNYKKIKVSKPNKYYGEWEKFKF